MTRVTFGKSRVRVSRMLGSVRAKAEWLSYSTIFDICGPHGLGLALTTYIPLWSGRVGNSKYLKGELVHEKEHDRFRCPQGKYLTPNPATDGNQKRYSSASDDCRDCPQTATCPARTKKATSCQHRFVLRSLDQDLFEEVQAKMEEPEFRKRLSERMWKAEGLFAEAKRNHGLARARYRGRSKVQIQAYLSAMTQNLKRLVFLFYCWLVAWWSHRPRKSSQSRADPSAAGLFQHARPISRNASYSSIKRCRGRFWDGGTSSEGEVPRGTRSNQGFWHFRLELLASGLTIGSNWGRRSCANDPKGGKTAPRELEKEGFLRQTLWPQWRAAALVIPVVEQRALDNVRNRNETRLRHVMLVGSRWP